MGLPICVIHCCKWEPNNSKDANAVAIFQDRDLVQNNQINNGHCVLKARQPPNKFKHKSVLLGFSITMMKSRVLSQFYVDMNYHIL